jgi:hypothetical protein
MRDFKMSIAVELFDDSEEFVELILLINVI